MRTALFRCAAAAAFLVAGGPVHAQTESWPTEGPPPPLLAPDVVFPPYELRTLENGLQIVYVGAFEQPAVNVRLLVRAGASSDAGAAAGLAELPRNCSIRAPRGSRLRRLPRPSTTPAGR